MKFDFLDIFYTQPIDLLGRKQSILLSELLAEKFREM